MRSYKDFSNLALSDRSVGRNEYFAFSYILISKGRSLKESYVRGNITASVFDQVHQVHHHGAVTPNM